MHKLSPGYATTLEKYYYLHLKMNTSSFGQH